METFTAPPVNVQLPADLAAQLEKHIQVTGQSLNAIAVAAFTQYLEAEVILAEEIAHGIVEAEQGEFASSADVSAFFAKYGA